MYLEHIITPIVVALGTLILTVVIGSTILLHFDENVQLRSNDAIHKFIDESTTAGYISPENYLQMANELGMAGNLYNIQLVHTSKVAYTATDANNNEIPGAYMNGYHAYYKDEILEKLFPENSTSYGTYPMKNGDYLEIRFSLKEPTLAIKLLTMNLVHKSYKSIHGRYGNYVGSTEENGKF